MALNSTERRRIFLATTLTVLALPALWWANQSESSSAPNVATVGVEVGANDSPASNTANSAAPSIPSDPLGESEPVFFDGPVGDAGFGAAEVAVPAHQELLTATATYSSMVPGKTLCMIPGIQHGSTITVVNLDNGRSATCVTVLSPSGATDDLVLHTDVFSELADLTDAPIPVEIHL